MLNNPQYISLVRAVIMIVGGIAVGRGWITQENLETFADPGFLTAVAGGILAIGTAVVAVKRRSTANLVDTVSKLPEVKAIITTKEVAQAAGPERPTIVSSVARASQLPDVPQH
jgi:hypothetical protein